MVVDSNGNNKKLRHFIEYGNKKYRTKENLSSHAYEEIETALRTLEKYSVKEEGFYEEENHENEFNANELKKYLGNITENQKVFLVTIIKNNGEATLDKILDEIWENIPENQRKEMTKTGQILAGIIAGLTKKAKRENKKTFIDYIESKNSYIIREPHLTILKEYFQKN